MNNVTKDLMVQYITETLNPLTGVTKHAVEILELLLINDRELAQELHEAFERISCNNNRYFILPPESTSRPDQIKLDLKRQCAVNSTSLEVLEYFKDEQGS